MTQALNSPLIHRSNIGTGGVQPAGGPPPAAVPAAPPAAVPVAPAVAAAGAMPPIGPARAQHLQMHSQGPMALAGRIKTGLNAFAAAVQRAFTFLTAASPAPAPTLQIPPSVQVNVAFSFGNISTVTIDKSQYEPMIKALPQNQQAAAVASLQGTLQGRIQRGAQLYYDVTHGIPTPPPSEQNVSDLMLALYAMAADQNEAFTNGAFSVKDDDGRLAKWLDSSRDVYVRGSSHLEAYQGKKVDGHRNKQRGIDVKPGLATGLPNGHRTVVYGVIPDHISGGDGPTRRLFLKTESHGCRLSLMVPGTTAAAKSPNMHIRDWHAADIPESIKHGLSFLETRGKQGDVNARKEHFTPDVTRAYKAALATAKSIDKSVKAIDASVVERLKTGNPEDGGGFCVLYRNVTAILNDLPNMNISDAEKRSLQQSLTQLKTVLEQHDRLDVRLGNEVLIG